MKLKPAAAQQNQRDQLPCALADCNRMTARFGLTLSPAMVEALLQKRASALMETGRVELSVSALPEIIKAFCDSPYLMQEEYEETLSDLMDAFYELKNESRDLLTDEELLSSMRSAYDASGGSVDAVIGIQLERLLGCRSLAEEMDADD